MTALFKSAKEKMVRNIMADIPEHDYESQAREYVLAAIKPLLPMAVQALLSDPKTRGWVATSKLSSNCDGIRLEIPSADHNRWLNRSTFRELYSAEIDDQFAEFCRLKTEQKEARRTIIRQLDSNFASVRTFAVFRQRFPELAHYLPIENVIANLPATNDLAEKLRAMGLPSADSAGESK